MIDSQQTVPTYNIKVVAQKTGVKPETIRSWERRYGLPQPPRTPSGHRRFSDHDIALIKWLAQRQNEGLRISSAVSQWQKLDDLEKPDFLSTFTEPKFPDTKPGREPGKNRMDTLCEAWIAACMAFDRPKAEQLLSQAFSLFEPEQVCLHVLQKGMAQIGMAWEQGDVTIQQEHFASALTMHRLETLVSSTPLPYRQERILVGCAPEDHHTFSPLLLTYLLRRQGWDVIYLGANVPAVAFGRTVNQLKPNLVIISAQRLYTAATLLDVARDFQNHNITFAFGGQIFNFTPSLIDRIPGHFLGTTLDGVAEKVASLLHEKRTSPESLIGKSAYLHQLKQYEMKHSLIESHIWGAFQTSKFSSETLKKINLEVFQAIVAALKLGDSSLLGTHMDWIQNLLTSFHLPKDVMMLYFSAYYQAALFHLDDSSNEIVAWLKKLCLHLKDPTT